MPSTSLGLSQAPACLQGWTRAITNTSPTETLWGSRDQSSGQGDPELATCRRQSAGPSHCWKG